jgi:hypothetical protein
VKVLFDHNVPKNLRHLHAGHEVVTAREMAWSELENGILLNQAEQAGFEIMITCDQNVAYQQNLSGREIANLILNTNNWKALQLQLSIDS